jgi:hypothetical protein
VTVARGRSRRVRALLAAVVVLVLGAAMGGVGPASAQEEPPADPPPEEPAGQGATNALDELASCVRGSPHLLVVVLIDESGSLLDTDPENQRVAAGRTALESLDQLVSQREATQPVVVEVQIAGFGAGYRPATPWERLDSGSLATLQDEVEGFAERVDGADTDFFTGIEGARQAMAERSAEITEGGDVPPCKALLLFTDGQFRVNVRTGEEKEEVNDPKPYAPDIVLDSEAAAEQATEAGIEAVCRPDGLADQVRSDGIVTVAIALAADLGTPGRTFLEGITSGGEEGSPCGDRPGLGTFLPAQDLPSLLRAFDEVANRIGGGTVVEGEAQVVCQGEPCDEGRREFAVDGSLRRLHVLATVPSPAVQLVLRGPSGDEVTFGGGADGGEELDGAALSTAEVVDTAFTVDVELPPDSEDWIGTWSMTFVDPDGETEGEEAQAQLVVFSDIVAELVEVPNLRLGEEGEIEARIARSGGDRGPGHRPRLRRGPAPRAGAGRRRHLPGRLPGAVGLHQLVPRGGARGRHHHRGRRRAVIDVPGLRGRRVPPSELPAGGAVPPHDVVGDRRGDLDRRADGAARAGGRRVRVVRGG